MKKYFVQAIMNKEIDESLLQKVSKELPRDIAIFYSSQYVELANQIKSQLGKNIHAFAQTLGCSRPKLNPKIKAILLVSDGEFHAISLAYKSNLHVFVLNTNKLTKISEEQIKKFSQKKKSSQVNFLSAKKVGVIISTKPGQQRLKQALTKKLKDKEVYYFLSNNININEFENFPHIQAWINTACPRMDLNSNKIINIGDLD